MNSIESARRQIKQCGIIAIIRGDYSVDDTLRIGDALSAGGITVMEVTLNSSSALESLPKLRSQFRETMLIGAGTVWNVDQAKGARDAGAQFLVSPNLDVVTVSFAQSTNLLHLPGVFTVTEAQSAFVMGCRMLKLFPMDVVGAAYLKAIRAPLNDIDFVPTGGISLENLAEYALAGASAVGLGSKLVVNREQSSKELTARAKALRTEWERGKHG